MWKAIIHAKSIGCKWFEVGERIFSSDVEKEMGISDFKSGFGGQTFMSVDIKLSFNNHE